MKNKINYDVDLLLKKAFRSSETPDARLIQKVKQELIMKEEPTLKKQTIRRSFSAVAVIAAIMLITTTAFAAWHFLKPEDVAEKLGDHDLSEAFNSNAAMSINNPPVTSG
ncbi:MAG: DUF4179 domain-containing protein, partial [Syntrophomonadaceae bacterium]|nr:DUF4179 domain-containing protein [Syntrophomonadaceae bacterium]